ncbi:hypothetical protein BpHYR1_044526, partial [Brachionus plicatilis]
MLLDICGSYRNKWRIKFNPYKTKVVNFGTQLFKSVFHLNGSELEEANQLEYLGFIIDSNLDLNTQA